MHPAADRRREFLKRLLFTAGAVGFGALLPRGARAAAPPASATLRTSLPLLPGPLSRIGALQDSGLDGIWIPAGFSVRAVARSGSPPSARSGYAWHPAPDGGAVFAAPGGGWVYVSNSETEAAPPAAVPGLPSVAGGAGALRFDARGRVVDAYRILDGTRRNCAGGRTPWQTWLSCEEVPDGLVYECDPFGRPETARALPALGRFYHEAACVDLPARTLYLTEDTGTGRFYRFVADADDAVAGRGGTRLRLQRGRLQVMNVEGHADGGYIALDQDARVPRKVAWADVLEPGEPQAAVRARRAEAGLAAPGTLFKGGEGIWIHRLPRSQALVPPGGGRRLRSVVYFACKGDNRVYAYDVENQLLQSVFDGSSIDPPVDDVDNLVVSPAGDVVVAEDGEAMRLLVICPGAPARVLLRIALGGSELAGPAFTADGSRLYFSSQRGPSIADGPPIGMGVTYELGIPPDFR